MKDKASVQLEVINNQHLQRGEDDRLEYRGEGKLFRKNGKSYLIYEETGEGIAGARTTVKIAPCNERVLISRQGSGGLRQEFKAGKTHYDSYHTPGGRIQLKTVTEALNISLQETAGSVEIEYRLYIAGEYFSRNSLSIKFQIEQEE